MIVKDDGIADIDTPTGVMRCHLFRPVAEGKYPGIVLYSEIFQVTGPIRRTAAQVASQGFIVIVPEIYHEFEPAGSKTRLTDRIEYELPGGALVNMLFGWIVTLGLRNMFVHRHRVTQEVCGRHIAGKAK